MNLAVPTPEGSSLAVAPRILVVEDDPALRSLLTDYLAQAGMRVFTATDGASLKRQLSRHPSLVILDLHLGEEDGLDLLRRIRSSSDVPVIIVTGHRRDEIDRIVGLELGADDYMTKPFGLRELLARVRTVLRRRTLSAETPGARTRGRVRFGAWELDRYARTIQREPHRPVSLTKGEFALLHAFLDAPQRALSREHLLRATRVHEDVFDRSIDVQVLRLRRKLAAGGDDAEIIATIRGVGYIFRAEVEIL